jgi:protein-S-isoprenylcysteine O-methyltransferase Ste14
MTNIVIIRVFFVLLLGFVGYFLTPFQNMAGLTLPQRIAGGLAGLAVGVGIVFFEMRVREVSLKRLIGSAIGSILGIVGAVLMAIFGFWAGLDGDSRIGDAIRTAVSARRSGTSADGRRRRSTREAPVSR